MESFDLGDFRLRSGITVPGATLEYTTRGTLNAARDNVILFPTFLGGSVEALDAWIGPGRPLDPQRWFLVLPGHFGLPGSTAPSTAAAPFDRGAFPAVEIADDVAAQRRLLAERFEVERVALVLGWSVGALQTYEWAIRFPDAVRRVAAIAGAPHPSPWTRLWLRTVIEAPLVADARFQRGWYADGGDLAEGMRLVGRNAALTLTPPGFYREGQEVWRQLGFGSTDDFVARFWENFWLAQDPNDVIAQARKAHAADPTVDLPGVAAGDLGAALARITADTAVIAFTGDPMFTPEQSRADAERISGARYHQIDSPFGHLATFGLSPQDVKAVDTILDELLS